MVSESVVKYRSIEIDLLYVKQCYKEVIYNRPTGK